MRTFILAVLNDRLCVFVHACQQPVYTPEKWIYTSSAFEYIFIRSWIYTSSAFEYILHPRMQYYCVFNFMNVLILPNCLFADIHFQLLYSQKLFWISPKSFSWLDVSVFVCALGDFLVLSAPVLRQIARYLPHHRSGNASKTHPKSSHDKFKTASQSEIKCEKTFVMLNEVKHLGCAHVDVYEILHVRSLRWQYIKNFSQTNFVLL